jgi:hypothetical protein
VGNGNQSNPPRVPLTAGCWGIVCCNEHIYLEEGTQIVRHGVLLTIFSVMINDGILFD